ncbi:MAG: PKD domain-containing protein [Thermodesulfobacteriota bacterium]|nr:PKD domain-containing protein [Thermodesulfobacteriota bacterium]
MIHPKFIAPLIILITILISPLSASADALLVSWEANTEPDLAGYKVYYGLETRNYETYINVGNVTSHLLDGLDYGHTYYVAVTAYDTLGNESGYSKEVWATIPVPDTAPNLTIISPSEDVSILEGESVNFHGSASGGDTPLTFSWDFDGGAQNSNQENPGYITFSTAGTYIVTFTVTDSDGDTDNKSVTVTVAVPDTTPPTGSMIINSGVNITPSRNVTLRLSATDSEGPVAGMKFSNDGKIWSGEYTYAVSQQWMLSQGDGTKTVYVIFKDACGNWMSTPASDSIELKLDSDNDGIPDLWEVTYGLDPNDPSDAALDSDGDGISNLDEYHEGSNPSDESDHIPVANAGPDQQTVPTRVYLDGSESSDPNGDALGYAWSQVLGPVEVDIESATSACASFVATTAGLYRFMLTCSDAKVKASDTVDITVLNVAPSVDAGSDLTIDAGQEVELHASGSDPNNDELSYHWSLIEGLDVELPDMDAQDVKLTLYTSDLYRFLVTCSDGMNVSIPDEVVVSVNAVNQAPTAHAGLDTDVQVDEKVSLDGGRSSDPDGDELTYTWVQVSGTEVILHDADTAWPWFDAIYQGTLVFELTVWDGIADSVPDRVTIRVLEENTAPVADAGDDIRVRVGDKVVLDASGSYDPDGDSLSFMWIQVSGAVVELIEANTNRTSFTPTTSGVLEFEVSLFDGKARDKDRIMVTVDDANYVPIADAGEDIVVSSGQEVTLDGSNSYDQDGDELSFIWSQIEGTRVSLSYSNTELPSFLPPEKGAYVFELSVYDGANTSKPDRVSVTVQEEKLPFDQDSDGIPDDIEESWGLDSFDPMDSLLDLDGDGVVNLVEYMEGTDPFDPSDRPETDYVLKDIIGQVNVPVDLKEINLGGYTIKPLTDDIPAPYNNLLDISVPGTYLYNVFDAGGNLVHRLRVSMASAMLLSGVYNPDIGLSLNEQSMGIKIELPAGAISRQVPIGIGGIWGTDIYQYSTSCTIGVNTDLMEFDIIPYDLALESPAIITLACNIQNPVVERYDTTQDAWINIDNVNVHDGCLIFKTQTLGHFRVYSEKDNPIPFSAGSGKGGSGCFISTAGI